MIRTVSLEQARAGIVSRVIAWTERDGVTSVSDVMPEAEAEALAALLREANPPWLGVEVERVSQ